MKKMKPLQVMTWGHQDMDGDFPRVALLSFSLYIYMNVIVTGVSCLTKLSL
jgi:hypothetical protein